MSNQEAIALLRNLEDSLDAYCELNEKGKTAFRMAIEALSCSEFPNSSDTIYRQAAIEKFEPWLKVDGYSEGELNMLKAVLYELRFLPPAQPDVPDISVGDINKFIDGLEEIFADIRERHVDDSVCGLCEYDGAYIGQSGDWCNECPGFDRDDCFKLSDKCRKQWIDTITNSLPSAQRTCVNCGRTVNNGGWYADGRTRCPIEEHYALPKDGYCHLWEKRNVTDDDYPERREE